MFLFFVILSIFTLLFLRLLWILPSTHPSATPSPRSPHPNRNEHPKHLMILLGSGGHTAEMLFLLSSIRRPHLFRRSYIYTSGDALSAAKGAEFEASLSGCDLEKAAAKVHAVPRARRVKQSWISTPWDAIKCLIGCVSVFQRTGVPDVVLTNGPGSAVLLILVVVAMRFLGLAKTRTVYVESFARVSSLSLSGKILYPIVDRFLVQWPRLSERYPRAEYKGVLVFS